MALRLGMQGKLYITEGSYGSTPSWQEVANAKDVTLNLSTSEADATTRDNAGWRATVATLRDASVDFEIVWDTEDDVFTILQEAFLASEMADKVIGVAVMDGDITEDGVQGLQFDGNIMSFTRNEGLEDVMRASVTIKPTFSQTAPAWVTISGS